MEKNKNCDPLEYSGFSLMEMALVLMMSGLVIASLSHYYMLYLKQGKDGETFDRIRMAKGIVAEYYTDHDHYPCPTDPQLVPGDPNYGMEMCPGRTVNGLAVPALAPGACFGGMCRVESERGDIDGDGNIDTVLIGAFPFRNIVRDLIPDPTDMDPSDGIDEIAIDVDFDASQTLDGWNNKFVYAVTESMTDSTTYNNNMGVVTINDEFGQSLVEPENSAHYVIMSMGENGRGAYNIYGNIVGDSCDPATVALPDPNTPTVVSRDSIEYQNCNHENSIFINALKNETPGDNFNDDMVSFEVWVATELWGPSPINPQHIYNLNIGNVGVGVDDPTERLDIAGDIQAMDLLMNEICDVTTGMDCFQPEVLGGQIADGKGMKCPNGEAMIGIEKGKSVCAPILSGAVSFTGTCPAGNYVYGITNKGRLLCKPI